MVAIVGEGIATNEAIARAAHRLRDEPMTYWVSEELPWRQLRTPYRVFLAELLLIRTHTRAVADVFDDVVAKYPDLSSLASADEDQLAAALKTLGLKKRVPLLIDAARHLVAQHGSDVPKAVEDLLRVPGLGLYTAVAIAAFAFDSPEVPADVNILRLLSRLTGLCMKHPTKGSKEIRALLPLLSRDAGGPEPESLLDFSRKICRPRNPQCSECLLSAECEYCRAAHQEEAG